MSSSLPADLPADLPATLDLPADLGLTFDHVAIANRRIRDLLPLWVDALGGRFALGADNIDTGWRTVRVELGGATVVELIEPLGDSTLFDKFFAANPRGGVHHVTFLTDDVRAAFRRLEEAGFEPFGADERWFQLFVHPRNAQGVLVQLMARRGGKGDSARPEHTLDDVLAGHGIFGTGIPSP